MLCKQTYSLVRDVVESSNSSNVLWGQVKFILLIYLYALRCHQIFNGVFNQLTDEVIQVLGCSAAEIVVVWIGC